MTRLLTLTFLAALGLSASCTSPSPDDAGSGGAPTAAGGSGGIAAAGGTASGGAAAAGGSGGSTPTSGSGGQEIDAGGAAGAAGAPTCDCPEDTHVTLELPDDPRVYELTGGPDSCNLYACEPPGASVSLGSWRHDRYTFHACHPDGDCIALSTDEATFTTTEGELMVLPISESMLADEPITLEMTVLEGDGYTTVDITFESAPDAEVDFHGTGRACLVESGIICAI